MWTAWHWPSAYGLAVDVQRGCDEYDIDVAENDNGDKKQLNTEEKNTEEKGNNKDRDKDKEVADETEIDLDRTKS